MRPNYSASYPREGLRRHDRSMTACRIALIASMFGVTAFGQLPGQYPPGQYPPGQGPPGGRYPGGQNPPQRQPRQNEPKPSNTPSLSATVPQAVTTGMLRAVVGSQLVLQ